MAFQEYEIVDFGYITLGEFSMFGIMMAIYGASSYSTFGSLMCLATVMAYHSRYGNYLPEIKLIDVVKFSTCFYAGVAIGMLLDYHRSNTTVNGVAFGTMVFGILLYAKNANVARKRFFNKMNQ